MSTPRPPVPLPGLDSLHAQRLLLLAGGVRLAGVVHTLAELGVADELAAGPRTPGQLAEACAADPDALRRLLRCAAAVGVFAERDDSSFQLTPLAEGLRSTGPDSIRALVLHSGSIVVRSAYGELLHSARTGRPAVEKALGCSLWEYLDGDPDAQQQFDRLIAEMSGRMTGTYLRDLRAERFGRIADLGGGRGHFLAAVLQEFPRMRGTLVERAAVLPAAGRVLTAAGVADRAELVAGDLLTDQLPADCDAYVLMGVLHNWPDYAAARLLRGVRAAVGERDARLFVLEQVLGPANRWDHAALLDVDMLAVFGGRERGPQEWRELLADAGFELVRTTQRPGWNTLECRTAA